MSDTFQEEESGDFDFTPRKAAAVPEPEPDNVSSQSISSAFSHQSDQMSTPTFSNSTSIQSMFHDMVSVKSQSQISKSIYNPENLQRALDSNDYDEMLKQATLMINGLSLRFASIMKQIDANEAKITQLEETYIEQKRMAGRSVL